MFVGAVGRGLEDVDEVDEEALLAEDVPLVVTIACTLVKTRVDTTVLSTLFPPLTMMVGNEVTDVERIVVKAVEAD